MCVAEHWESLQHIHLQVCSWTGAMLRWLEVVGLTRRAQHRSLT